MTKFFIVLCIAFSVSSFSQNRSEIHKISLKDERDTALDFNFYVENVYDGRQFKENIGTVQKGGFNRKVLADFEQSLVEDLSDYLTIICPKDDTKSSISIRVNDLYISELTRAMSETGYATIAIDIIENQNGVNYVVGSYNASAESNGMDVTRRHDERIKKGLIECLTKYRNATDSEKIAVTFIANEVTKNKTILEAPAKGLYFTYVDVLNNKPLDDSAFKITNKRERFYLFNESTKLSESNYYGFSDGLNFYVNVAKYANSPYYAKSEIIGGKYFIEDVVYNSNNAIAMGAMFGLLGVAIASATSDSSIPMMIDCYTGQPLFLSNAEMKVFLSSNSELLREFKNSDKTSASKKQILKKYYQNILTKL